MSHYFWTYSTLTDHVDLSYIMNYIFYSACYGIVTVPTGPWFCRKCESQERAARVRCELCPSKDGALKRTDNNGWAHVVCALYIPEVRFGNVATMEPIILQLVPTERYNKVPRPSFSYHFLENILKLLKRHKYINSVMRIRIR